MGIQNLQYILLKFFKQYKWKCMYSEYINNIYYLLFIIISAIFPWNRNLCQISWCCRSSSARSELGFPGMSVCFDNISG